MFNSASASTDLRCYINVIIVIIIIIWFEPGALHTYSDYKPHTS
jgi:hypothetical protein